MIYIRQLKPKDVPEIGSKLQSAQREGAPFLTLEYGTDLVEAGPAWVISGENGPFFAAGFAEQFAGCYRGWAMLTGEASRHLRMITRETLKVIRANDWPRIETPVRTDFYQGHHWMRMLGFQREGTMRNWMYGIDYDLYARVKRNG